MQHTSLFQSGRIWAGALLLLAACGARPAAGAETEKMTEIDPGTPVELHAGPVRLKLQDGQLRYLYAGDTEVFRRLYFAVRDGSWATIPPHFTAMRLEQRDDGFTVEMEAECRREPVDYKWSGRVEGTPDGKITFRAEGEAGADFQSNRIGFCLLYGTGLLGTSFQTFESTDGAGEPVNSVFPPLVSPSSKLVGKRFKLLRYTSNNGPHVSGGLEGATFDMEDQRNWGDSSFKAYAPLPYHYPSVAKGDRKAETITLHVTGAPREKYATPDSVRLRVGEPIQGAKVPRLVGHDPSYDKPASFVDINNNHANYAEAKTITWPYTSQTHLSDDDVLVENPPALTDQALSIRAFAPGASLHVGPVRLESWRDGAHDPRRGKQFAAAWSAEVLRAMALGGVDEALFDVGDGPGYDVLRDIGNHQEEPLLSVEAVPARGAARLAFDVLGLAVKTNDGPVVWVLNRSPKSVNVVLEGLGRPARAWPLGKRPDQPPQPAPNETEARFKLEPYEVKRVQTAN